MFTRTTRAKRNIATVALAALVGSLLALSSPAAATATAEPATDRLSGLDRYETAAAIAQSPSWYNNAAVPADAGITIVNGDNFPDGLAASTYGNRVLLVKKDSVPQATIDAIAALEDAEAGDDGVGALVVVGGTGVISSAVYEQLGDLAAVDSIKRVSGADRYATALSVAKDKYPTPTNIVLATGTNFPDALSAGPLAIKKNAPVLLTSGSSLGADLSAYIATMTGASTVYVIGGEAVVPASIVTELKALGVNVKRLEGADRDATAVKVAEEIEADTAGADPDIESAVLVNRNSFADALAAGPFAASPGVKGAITLVGLDSVPQATADWHVASCIALGGEITAANAPTYPNALAGKVYVMGGSGVISDAVMATAAGAAKCAALSASATIATTDAVNRVFDVTAANWVAADDDTPQLTAVTGSDAGGLNGVNWSVLFGTAAGTDPDSASITDTNELTVLFQGGTDIDQEDFVSRFNALSIASALFTASARGLANDNAGGALTVADKTAASVKHTVTVTFSQAVGDNADFDVVPGTGVFDLTIGACTEVMSPLAGSALVGGATEFTITLAGCVTAASSTLTMDVIAAEIQTKGGYTLAADATIPVVAS